MAVSCPVCSWNDIGMSSSARLVWHIWSVHCGKPGQNRDGFCPACLRSFKGHLFCDIDDWKNRMYCELVESHLQDCPKYRLMRLCPAPFIETARKFAEAEILSP